MFVQKRGIEGVLKKLPNKSRFRFFLFFIVLSLTLWTSTKLSKVYQVVQPFTIIWEDLPKGIVLDTAPSEVNLSLRASGMEILWYRLFKTQLRVSLAELEFKTANQLINFERRYFDLQQQLFGSTQLNQISPSSIPLKYSRISSKKLAVRPTISINFRPGYLAVNRFKVTPDSIIVYGAENVLDTLKGIPTEEYQAEDVHQNIDHKLTFPRYEGIEYDTEYVHLYGTVLPFSEKTMEVPVQVLNLPEEVKIKLFPPTVNLVTTSPLDVLSSIQASDFILAVDYNQVKSGTSPLLEIQLMESPQVVKKIEWDPKVVNFLVRK